AQAVSRSVRALSHQLHPENLRLIGLVPALGRLQREVTTPELTVKFSHERVPPAPSAEVTLCVFRIAQEALPNTVAHSGASQVSGRLVGVDDRLVLTVADNGVGFDVDGARSGIGLMSMVERAEQVGGTVQIQSTRGGGTQLEVSVPVGSVTG